MKVSTCIQAGMTPILLAALIHLPAGAAPTLEDQVMEIVNQERWANGQLPPLKRNPLLDSSSETHSVNMAVRDFFQHCDPDDGSLPWDRMEDAGYTPWNSAAENIAAGYSSAASVMAGWMASTGHRNNILTTTKRELGIGYYYQGADAGNIRFDSNGDCTSDSNNNGPYYRYWTQNFGRMNSVYPIVIEREAYETVNSTVDLYVYGSGWAQDMRFQNESGAWSAWEPHATDVSWVLSPGNGVKTVNAEIRNGGTVRSISDDIMLNASADVTVAVIETQDPVPVSTNFSYRVAVTNNGTSDATGIELLSVLPAGVGFVSCTHTDSLSGDSLTCDIGFLVSGGTDTVDIVLSAMAQGSVNFSVDVAGAEFDPDLANNNDAEDTTIESGSTAVGDGIPGFRPVLTLRRSSPNPFRSATRISWYQPDAGPVRLLIFDSAGRLVTTLVDRDTESGDQTAIWNGRDDRGSSVSTGIFFGRLEAAGQVRTVKLLRTR